MFDLFLEGNNLSTALHIVFYFQNGILCFVYQMWFIAMLKISFGMTTHLGLLYPSQKLIKLARMLTQSGMFMQLLTTLLPALSLLLLYTHSTIRVFSLKIKAMHNVIQHLNPAS